MANVKVLKQDGLKYEMAVSVPKQSADEKHKERLVEISKTAKLPGFRPGKVPMAVIERTYGETARAEILDQIVSDAVEAALNEQKLRPALQPKVELVSMAADKDIEFKMEVETLPEVKLGDFSAIALERPTATVEDAKVDGSITTFAKRFREPAVAEGKAAEMGDVVVVDFDGSVDGEKRPGMKGEDHRLELGSKSFIDTFEEQLVGLKAGDEKTIKVTFPAEYHAAELAGKKADFEVKVKEVRQHKPIVLDDALAKELGFPGIDKLRERVRDDLDVDYKRMSRAAVKRKLMDSLADAYDFPVPQGLLSMEFDGIWKQVDEARKNGQLPEEDKNKSEETLRSEYLKIAERRIRLGLLLAEVARENKVEVTNNEMRDALMSEARRYPGQEKAVFDYYTKTQGALERLRAPLLEEKVVDFLIGKAKVTDKPVAIDELIKLSEEE